MITTCTITCTASSQQLTLGSGHSRLLAPRANELEFELDIDNQESVGFQVNDFVYAGHNYSVVVTATRNGIAQTWSRNSGVCSSPIETSEIDLDLDVTATAPGVAPLIGGGTVRIRFKGKPD